METSIEVQAPASAAWDLLTDTRRWSQWGPSVIAAGCDGHLIGPGSVGWVQTIVGLRLPFRITEFEAGRRWCWEVAGIPATGHRVEPLGPGRCRVVFEVPLLAAPYLAVCRVAGIRIRRICHLEIKQSLREDGVAQKESFDEYTNAHNYPIYNACFVMGHSYVR